MEDLDILKNIIPKRVFDFKFSTLMLFRCTRRRFANDFRNGKIYFNQPQKWIEEEEKGNKGRGDALEGTFISAKENDKSQFIEDLKKNYTNFCKDGYIYFRRKEIADLYSLCFYGLNDDSFTEKNVDDDGKVHYISRVENSYFTDFSDNITEKMYDSLDFNEQPVVLFISNPHKLFEKVINFFKKFGIRDEEIIISPVEYIDKKLVSISTVPFPTELLLKDKFYSKQSELRIIINSKNADFLKYMKENNNIIDIGNIEDITDIYEYYFHDLLIERTGKNEIIFTLPSPQTTPLNELNLQSLLEVLNRVINKKMSSTLNEEEVKELIDTIKEIIFEKYKMEVLIEGTQISIINATNETFKIMDAINEPHKKIQEFEQKIETLINNNDYDGAQKEIESFQSDSKLKEVGCYYLGKIFEKKGEFENAIYQYSFCIDNYIKKEDSLSSRSICFARINQHELALKDMELLQENIGYNPTIYSNKGINLLNLGRIEEAIEQFNKSIEMKEENAQAYYNRSVAYYRLQQFESAQNDVQKAIKYDPLNDFYNREYDLFYKKIKN